MLDAWDGQLAILASQIVSKREIAIKKLAMLANLMHRKITNSKENLTVVYQKYGMDILEKENLVEEY